MPISRRKKLAIGLLGVYWPAFFVVNHIPLPESIQAAHLSDKTLHVVCYMILAFLLWSVIFPQKRVDWRRAAVWWMVFGIVWYGVLDELIQAKVQRTPDVRDFAADMAGTLISLTLLSVLDFWKVFLTVAVLAVFGVSNVARENPAQVFPVTNTLFYIGAYGVLTGLWVRNLRDMPWLNAAGAAKAAIVVGGPLLVLAVVKVCSVLMGKPVEMGDIAIAMGAILGTAGLLGLWSLRGGTGAAVEGG